MTEQTSGTDVGRVVAEDERLSGVQERIDEAKAAEGELHDQDALGDTGEVRGSGRAQEVGGHQDPDEHGAFEPSGDDRQAGTNPSEGRDDDTPGEAGSGEHPGEQ